MKRIFMRLMVGLMMFLSVVDALAGDSLSLSISCTIPAIPGVNAPLIEEETSKTKVDATTQQKVESQEETRTPTPAIRQEDAQEEKIVDEGQNAVVMVKTIYSR